MQNFKDKMYNHKVTPPSECWSKISTLLDKEKINISIPVKKSKVLRYSLAVAATVAVMVFSLIIWSNKNSLNKNETAAIPERNSNKQENYDVSVNQITVPKITPVDETSANETESKKSEKSILEANNKRYITIAGPQGQPVKISSKAAELIVSSDAQNPPKPVWSAKVQKWKDIMKANTLTATTADFLDIVELTHALTMNNP